MRLTNSNKINQPLRQAIFFFLIRTNSKKELFTVTAGAAVFHKSQSRATQLTPQVPCPSNLTLSAREKPDNRTLTIAPLSPFSTERLTLSNMRSSFFLASFHSSTFPVSFHLCLHDYCSLQVQWGKLNKVRFY